MFDKRVNIKKSIKYLLECMTVIALFWVCDEAGIEKYAVSILLSLILLFIYRKKQWSMDVVICTMLPMAVYLFMGCLGAVFHGNFYESTVKIILFWLTPYLVAFALYMHFGERMERVIDFQLLSTCILFFKPNPTEILSALMFETVYAFTFGLFVIYYVYKKRWGLMLVSLAFMYMSDKRITFLAIMAALVVMAILWLFRNNKKMGLFLWGCVSVVVSAYTYLVYSGTLEYFCSGLGINTNGRVKMYGRLAEWYDRSFFLFGKGIGVVEMILEQWKISAFANLHNDLLKFYVELGFLGFSLFLISFGAVIYQVDKKIGKSQMSFVVSVAVYSFVLFFTDNVSIYLLYLLPMYCMLFAVFTKKEEGK